MFKTGLQWWNFACSWLQNLTITLGLVAAIPAVTYELSPQNLKQVTWHNHASFRDGLSSSWEITHDDMQLPRLYLLTPMDRATLPHAQSAISYCNRTLSVITSKQQEIARMNGSCRMYAPWGSNSNRARQLYNNISMLFLFPVKDGKLSTGVNATFNASCYG